ncbi:hypothetical protein Droror1_Dr00001247 [Drosera rotundifolia]
MGSLFSSYARFKEGQEQDAQEFLEVLSNKLVEQEQRSAADDRAEELLVHKTFQGTLIEEARCLRCENITETDTTFLNLSLDIEEDTSITCFLKNYCLTKLDGSNAIHCDQCNSIQDAQRRKTMKKPPQILVLHLKRFERTTISFRSA